MDRIQNHIPDLPYTDLDREIWQNELEHFVPRNIFDSHTHLWSSQFITPETRCTNDWLEHETDGEMLRRISRLLYPGRNCDVLGFAQPVIDADYARLNSWAASEVHSVSPDSRAAMLITGETAPEEIVGAVRKYSFAALKPYYHFAKPDMSGIQSYFSSEQMAAADELNLAVVLHCRSGIAADADELEACAKRFPHIQWILAHCGAAYNPRGMTSAVRRLASFSNVWFDTAGICETYPQAMILKYVNRKRILFGSDNALGTGGCRRGRVMAYADSVLWFKETAGTTFWLYEQLRAMRRACELLEPTAQEVEDIFYFNAARLFQIGLGQKQRNVQDF